MMTRIIIFNFLLLIAFIQSVFANGYGGGVGGYAGVSSGGGQGVSQIHLPHQVSSIKSIYYSSCRFSNFYLISFFNQLLNVLDLLIPFHVRVATDGIKHKP